MRLPWRLARWSGKHKAPEQGQSHQYLDGPPRRSDAVSIELKWISNRSNRKNVKCHFWRNQAERPEILSNWNPIRKNLGTMALIPSKVEFFIFATFGRIKPIIPGFFRIGFQFERIPGRLAQFLQKWRSKFLRFLNIESIESIKHIEHNPYRSYRSKTALSPVSSEWL